MFKFSFTNSEDSSQEKNEVDTSEQTLSWAQSEEIRVDDVENYEDILGKCESKILQIGNMDIRYISPLNLMNTSTLPIQNVLKAEQYHSDLLTGIYEGGLKIWECTYDLINFIDEKGLNFSNKTILDLGCGAGLVGILCCLRGGCTYFQDYNQEVLRYSTIPNLAINVENTSRKEMLSKCKYYSGDWRSFIDCTKQEFREEENKLDYIFTSETIYNTENYSKLCEVFKHCLKQSGTIYLAAKYYYFGVGGGISSFTELLSEEQIFKYLTCWSCIEGVRREILEISFK